MNSQGWLRSSNDDYGAGSIVGSESAAAGGNRTLRVLVGEAGLSNRMFRTVVELSGRDMRRRNFLLDSAFSAAAIR